MDHVVAQLILHLATAASSSSHSKLVKSDSKDKPLKYPRVCPEGSIQSTPSSPKNSKRERTVQTCSAESNTSNANATSIVVSSPGFDFYIIIFGLAKCLDIDI